MISAQRTITKLAISPVSCTAGMTAVGFIDTLDADYLKLDVCCSDIAGSGVASAIGGSISIGEATDTNVSNATTIVADRTDQDFGRAVTYLIDTKTRKRYIHVTCTAHTSGSSNAAQVYAAVGTVFRVGEGPSSTGGMVTGLTNSAAVIVTA